MTNGLNDWAYAASVGFRELGYEIKPFNDIVKDEIRNTDVLVAFIEDIKIFLRRNGYAIPTPFNIPEEFINSPFLSNRNIEIMSFGDFKNNPKRPIFVKPYEEVKAYFPSGVISSVGNEHLLFKGTPDDFKVMISDVVDMVTEYRCFIHKGNLVDIKHYNGDFTLFPRIDTTNNLLTYVKTSEWYANIKPMSFTIDVAVVKHQDGSYSTELIELQDFWAIGHYGLDPVLYAKMLRDRWYQIIKK
jgi:hypothetical protein